MPSLFQRGKESASLLFKLFDEKSLASLSSFFLLLMSVFTMKNPRFFASVTVAFALGACASAIDTGNQKLYIQTPGATEARCVLKTEEFRLVAYPPKPVLIRRMADPLTVTCQAPGNREKVVVVRPVMNKTAVANAGTAGLGAVYDHFSGALYEYPSPVIVSFSNVRARAQTMPAYHAPDTVSPFDQINEDMQDRPAQTPQDQGLVTTAPKKAKNIISKEQQNLEPYKSEIERPY